MPIAIGDVTTQFVFHLTGDENISTLGVVNQSEKAMNYQKEHSDQINDFHYKA